MAAGLELALNTLHFLAVFLRGEGLVEDVILFVFHVHAAKAVFEVFGKGAELAVRTIIALEQEVACVIQGRMDALVTPFVFKTHGVVGAVFIAIGLDAVKTVLEGEGVMAAVTVFGFGQMIPDAVFAAELVHAQIGSFAAQGFDPLLDKPPMDGAAEVKRRDPFFIFRFRELLIEDAVLLLVKPHTAETAGAAEAIFAELAFTAVLAILGIIDFVTARAIRALDAPFAVHAEGHVAGAHALS